MVNTLHQCNAVGMPPLHWHDDANMRTACQSLCRPLQSCRRVSDLGTLLGTGASPLFLWAMMRRTPLLLLLLLLLLCRLSAQLYNCGHMCEDSTTEQPVTLPKQGAGPKKGEKPFQWAPPLQNTSKTALMSETRLPSQDRVPAHAPWEDTTRQETVAGSMCLNKSARLQQIGRERCGTPCLRNLSEGILSARFRGPIWLPDLVLWIVPLLPVDSGQSPRCELMLFLNRIMSKVPILSQVQLVPFSAERPAR